MLSTDILNIIQTFGIVLALVLTIIQIKKTDARVQLSIDSAINNRTDDLNNTLLENPDVLAGLSRPYQRSDESYSSDMRSIMVYRFLNFFDELFYYKKKNLLNETTWVNYLRSMKKFLRQPYCIGFWKDARTEYEKDFQTVVDEILEL